MNPIVQEQDLASYATDAFTTQKPTGTDYTKGVEVGKTVPAKWWNWLFNAASNLIHQALSDFTALHKELINTLTDADITPDATDSSQLIKAAEVDASARIHDYIQDNVTCRFQQYQAVQETAVCADFANGTFSRNNIISIDYNEHLAVAVVYETGKLHIVISEDLIHWESVHAVADTILDDGTAYIAAGVILDASEEAYVSLYFQTTTEASGPYTYEAKEFVFRSTDCISWETVLSLNKSGYISTCRPALLKLSSSFSFAPRYLSPLGNSMYYLGRTPSKIPSTDLSTLKQYDANMNTSRGYKDDARVALLDCTINNVTGCLAGNLFFTTTGITVLDAYIFLGGSSAYLLKSGDYVVTYRSRRIHEYTFIIRAENGSVEALPVVNLNELGNMPTRDMAHYEPQVPGYIIKYNNSTKVLQFSADGIAYKQLPFSIDKYYPWMLALSGRYYITEVTQDPDDVNVFNVTTYSIKGELSEDKNDYVIVSKVQRSFTYITRLVYLGVPDVWFGSKPDFYVSTEIVITNLGRHDISTSINYASTFRSANPDYITMPSGKDYVIFCPNGPVRVLGSAAKVSGSTLYMRKIRP